MKKIIWFLALIPLCAISWFYFLMAHPPEEMSRETKASSKPQKMVQVSPQTSSVGGDGRLHGQKLRDKINEGMAKIASLETPELQRELLERLMHVREPRYRALFEGWQLAPLTADKALTVIREREAGFQEALRKHDVAGLAGGSDFVAARAYEKALADVQLIDLLGESRFIELSQLEKKMEAESVDQARKLLSGRYED